MGKSNKSLYAQICATRRKTWGRDRKKLEREAALYIQSLEREALEAKGVQDDAAEEIPVTSDASQDEVEDEGECEDDGDVMEEAEDVEPTEDSKDKHQAHKLMVVSGDDKRTQFLTLVQEILQTQSGQRNKAKVIILANTFETAKALVPAIAPLTKKAVIRSRGKGRLAETKGVVLLNNKETEYAVDGFKSGKYNILVTTDADLQFLWEMRSMITMVVNYDLPKDMKAFKHRARFAACKQAEVRTVISLFTPSVRDMALAPELADYLLNGPSKDDLPPTFLQIADMARQS